MFIDSLSFLTVQAVPAPCSTNALLRSRISDGGSSQNEMLFSRGNAINYINLNNLFSFYKLFKSIYHYIV